MWLIKCDKVREDNIIPSLFELYTGKCLLLWRGRIVIESNDSRLCVRLTFKPTGIASNSTKMNKYIVRYSSVSVLIVNLDKEFHKRNSCVYK